ncbi:hypothetical protein ElyMa_001971900, partial [Elysia marginata]
MCRELGLNSRPFSRKAERLQLDYDTASFFKHTKTSSLMAWKERGSIQGILNKRKDSTITVTLSILRSPFKNITWRNWELVWITIHEYHMEKSRDRLAETLKKWQNYKELLDTSHLHLSEEFPAWLTRAEQEVPDTLEHAQRQREATQAELEKLYAMKQQLLTAARQCDPSPSNPGSTDHLDKTQEDTLDSPLNQFADQVNKEVVSCINQ